MSAILTDSEIEQLLLPDDDDFGLTSREHHDLEFAYYQQMERIALERDKSMNSRRRSNDRPMAIVDILAEYPSPPNPPPELVEVVEWYDEVEMSLPDYLERILEMARGRPARSWFASIWAYEEQTHHLGLSKWLEMAGARSKAQIFHTHAEVLHNRWTPIGPTFKGPSKYLMYTTLQERATAFTYNQTRKLAKSVDQLGLSALCLRLHRDEIRHYEIYRDMCQLLKQRAPERFAHSFYNVWRRFVMPYLYVRGTTDYESKRALSEQLGITPSFAWMKHEELRTPPKGIATLEEVEAWNRKVATWNGWIDYMGHVFDEFQLARPNNLNPALKLKPLEVPRELVLR